jgi:serine/arginine repetitive matrix protein 2
MYNGIGLPSARGSGTNGYIVKSLSHIKKKSRSDKAATSRAEKKKTSKQVLEHEEKRQIEIKVLEYEEELEKEPGSVDIERKVQEYRIGLLLAYERNIVEQSSDSGISKIEKDDIEDGEIKDKNQETRSFK